MKDINFLAYVPPSRHHLTSATCAVDLHNSGKYYGREVGGHYSPPAKTRGGKILGINVPLLDAHL